MHRSRSGPGETPKTVQEQLDEALADSFPASDPVSLVTSQEEEDWGPGNDSTAGEHSAAGEDSAVGDDAPADSDPPAGTS